MKGQLDRCLMDDGLERYTQAGEIKDLLVELAQLLSTRGETLALAESCTGGWLAKLVTDLPGSSNFFWGGVCSYSNDSKEIFLGVKKETLTRYGAVSPETAGEMAQGIIESSGASWGISITGIAGPDGGSEKKPVGLVFIGLIGAEKIEIHEFRLMGSRAAIRLETARLALELLRKAISSTTP